MTRKTNDLSRRRQRAFEAVLHGTKQGLFCAVHRVTHVIYPGSLRPARSACAEFVLKEGIRATHFVGEV